MKKFLDLAKSSKILRNYEKFEIIYYPKMHDNCITKILEDWERRELKFCKYELTKPDKSFCNNRKCIGLLVQPVSNVWSFCIKEIQKLNKFKEI